jgi:hypothetical protein
MKACCCVLRQHEAINLADGRGKLALVSFSLGGTYALDLSVTLAEEIAAGKKKRQIIRPCVRKRGSLLFLATCTKDAHLNGGSEME